MLSDPDAPDADHHWASVGGSPRCLSRAAAMAVGRLALGGGLDLRRLVGILPCRGSLVASLQGPCAVRRALPHARQRR